MDIEIIYRLCECIETLQEVIKKQEYLIAQNQIQLTDDIQYLKEKANNNLNIISTKNRKR